MPVDPSLFSDPTLRKKHASEVNLAEEQRRDDQRVLNRAAQEQESTQKQAEKDRLQQSNTAAESAFRAQDRPFYKNEMGVIVPEQDDAAFKASQDQKKQQAAQKVRYQQEGRKFTTNAFDGSLVPLESDTELVARQQEELEKVRRESLTRQMHAVKAEGQLSRPPLSDSERRRKEGDLKKARQNASLALTSSLSEQAKGTDKAGWWDVVNNNSTPEAVRAQERLTRLMQPDSDLDDEDLTELEASEANKPLAEKLRSARQALKDDDDARTARETTRLKMVDLGLRRDAPDRWEQLQRERMASMDANALAEKTQADHQSLQERRAAFEQRVQAYSSKTGEFQRQMEDISRRNEEAKQKGVPAGELLNMPDGSVWQRSLAAELFNVQARAQAFEADPGQQRERQDLLAEETELNREIKLLRESAALTEKKRQAEQQKQLASMSEIPAFVPHVQFIAAAQQERAVRKGALDQRYPDGKETSPEAAAAYEALDQDFTQRIAPMQLALEQSQKQVQESIVRAYDMVTQSKARGTNRAQALQLLQQETGVAPQVAEKMLSDAEKNDWGRGAKETARVLSDGRVIVSPELAKNEAGYKQAVNASQATPEAKAQAIERYPAIREQSMANELEALSTLTEFRDWQAKQTPGMSSEEMLNKWNKEQPWWKTQGTQLLLGMSQGVVGLFQSGVGAWEWLTKDQASADLYERLNRDAQRLGAASQALPSGQWTALGANMAVGSLPSIAVGGLVGRGLVGAGMGILSKVAARGVMSARQVGNLAKGLHLTGVAGTAGLQTFGSVYGEAVMGYQAQGYGLEEAQQKATIPAFASGFSTMALTAIGGFTGTEALARLGADKPLKMNLKEFAKAVFGGGLREGALEELPDQLIQSAIAIASYDPQRPLEQVLEEAAIAFFGGAALGSTFEALTTVDSLSLGGTGQQATPVGNLPETLAAAEAAIDGYTNPNLDEVGVARVQATARALLYIAQGDIDSLPDSDLALVGVGRSAEGKLENIDTGDGRPPRVKIENGQPIITQPTLDRLAQEMPDVRAAIPLDEAGRRQANTTPDETKQNLPAAESSPDQLPPQTQPVPPMEQGVAGSPPETAQSPASSQQPVELTGDTSVRAEQIATHLAERGLTGPQAQAAAQAIVAEQGVVGAEYTEQVTQQAFDDAMGRIGWVRGSGRKYQWIPPTDNATPPESFSSAESTQSVGNERVEATSESDISPAAKDGQAKSATQAPESAAASDARGPTGQGPASPAKGGADGTQGGGAATPAASPSAAGLDMDAFVTARQRAIAATPAAQRKNAVKLLGALEKALTKYGAAFDGVRFSNPDGSGLNLAGGGLVVNREKGRTFLDVDLPRWAAQHAGLADKASVVGLTEVEEEFIHRAAINVISDSEMQDFWRGLPPALQEAVYRGYHAVDIRNGDQPKKMPTKWEDVHAVQLGHEFLRMLVQDTQFQGRVSEAVAVDPGLGEQLLALLRQLVQRLRKLIDESPTATRVAVREYESKVTKEVQRLRKALPDPLVAKQAQPNIAQAGDNRSAVLRSGKPAAELPKTDFKPTLGATGTAHTDANDAIEYRWAVVDVSGLNISNADDGRINPEYPQELQPRDRTSAGSEAQVADIAKNMNLDRLSNASGVGDGAPIVGPDGVVESGNGRVMGMRRALTQDTQAARAYAKRLTDTAGTYGLTADQVRAVKHPVLVRVRSTDVDRVAFVLAANVSTIAPKREIEQAKIDAKQIVPDLFGTFVPSEDGQIFTAANADFIRGFISAIVPPAERPAIIDARGNLTQTGLRRIRNALFVHAYGDSPEALNALSRLTESIDATGSNIASALVAAAPRFAEQNARIAAGALYPLSITEDLARTVQMLQDIRNRGEKVSDFLAQDRIPGIGDDPTPLQKELLQFLDANAGRPRGIVETLSRYAAAVDGAGDPKQTSLFGDEPQPTQLELWNLASGWKTKETPAAPPSPPPVQEIPNPAPVAPVTTNAPQPAKPKSTMEAVVEMQARENFTTPEDLSRAIHERFSLSETASRKLAEALLAPKEGPLQNRLKEMRQQQQLQANFPAAPPPAERFTWGQGQDPAEYRRDARQAGRPDKTANDLNDPADRRFFKGTVAESITPKNALRVYRKLKKTEAEKGTLSASEARALERAERALGQLFLFDDIGRSINPPSLASSTKSITPAWIKPVEPLEIHDTLGRYGISAADSYRNPRNALALVTGQADPRTGGSQPSEAEIHGSEDRRGSSGAGVHRGLEALPRLNNRAFSEGLIAIPLADSKEGQEHLVYRDRRSGRAVKMTKPGKFGARSSLENYLWQMEEINNRFDDDVAIEGWVKLPNEPGPRLVTSQAWIEGSPSDLPEIDTYMRRKKFQRLYDGAWWDGTYLVTDALGKNFVTDARGHVHPIDLVIATPKSASQIERLDNLVAAQPQPQPPPEESAPLASGTKTAQDVNSSSQTRTASRIEAAANVTDTRPTQAQKEAENYRTGKVTVQGLKLSIENPQGSVRSGTDANGNAWSVTMPHHYGRILGTTGADKDHVDFFLGPNPESDTAYVINQRKPGNGHFDEHKVMLGFDSPLAAIRGYMASYSKGWRGQGSLVPLPIDKLKQWLAQGDMSRPITRQDVAQIEVSAPVLATSPKSEYDENNGRRPIHDGGRGIVHRPVLDRWTSGVSEIGGSRVTREQGQRIGALWRSRLRRGLRESAAFDWTPGEELSSRLAAAFPGVPVLTPAQFGRLSNLPIIGSGFEGDVHADRETGVVYKLINNTGLSGAGIWNEVDWTPEGRLEWLYQPASRPRHLGLRMAILNLMGGTPTELVGFSPMGTMILKQPLSPDPKAGESGDLFQARRDLGIIDVPSALVHQPGYHAGVVFVEGKPWLVTDIKPDNFVGDNQGNVRFNDPVLGQITADTIKNIPGLADVVRLAKAEANRLGDRSARLFKGSVTDKGDASPMARLGWNHLDRHVSAKLAAFSRWMNEKTGAGETVAKWAGAENVKPFRALVKLIQRELFPDSVLPREVLARRREMEIKASLGAQRGMDLVRALSGTPKFSDIAYPAEFARNPHHRKSLYMAMTGETDMAKQPPEMQALAKRLRGMLLEMGREAVKQGRMSLDTFDALQAGYMPHFYAEDVQREKSLFHRFRLGIRDIFAQRTTAWHIVDTSAKDETGQHRIVSWEGSKWRFRNEGHRDAFYEDFILQEALSQITSRGGKATRSLTLSDLRAPAKLDPEVRGRLKEITANLRARYQKERPLTTDEQEKAGLIMDPVYSIARYMAQMVHDNSTAEWFNFVAANPQWVAAAGTPGFTEIPDNPRFGKLAGKYVQEDIAGQVLEMAEAPNAALQIYDTMLGWWKMGKTVYNVGTHVRNVLSNVAMFAPLAGISIWNPGNIRYYREAVTALRNGGKDLQEAYEMGVLGADFVSAELRQTLRQLLPDPATIQDDGKAPSILMGIGKSVGRFVPQILKNPVHRAHNQITALYQAEDEVFKLAAYLKAKSMGMSPEQARDHVRQWFPYFDSGSSTTLKTIGRTTMPFLSFYRESIRIFGEALKHRPLALAAGLAVPSMLTFLSAMLLGLDDEDMDDVKRTALRGKASGLLGLTPLDREPLFSMLLPKRTEGGGLQQFDLSAIYPFTDLLGERLEGTDGQDWWQRQWRKMITAGPFLSLAYAYGANEDPFSGRPLVEPGMSGWEGFQKRFEHTYQALLPPLTPGIPGLAVGGSNIETLSNAGALPGQDPRRSADKTLQVRSPGEAVLRAVFGLDVRQANPNLFTLADEWRKANGYEMNEGTDFGSTTPASRARRALFQELIQDTPNVEAIRNITRRLKEWGHPVETEQDINRLLFYRDPLKIIGGNRRTGESAAEAQQRFRASLNPEARRILETALQTFQKIRARAPALLQQAK